MVAKDFTEQNKQALIDYIKEGCKGADLGRVGMEQEHFILDEDGQRVPYQEKHGRLGVKDILESLSEFYPEKQYSDRASAEGTGDAEGAKSVGGADGEHSNIVGCSRKNASITLEPASQIEVSLAPFTNMADVEQEYRNFLFRLEQIIKPHDYTVACFGYSPVEGQVAKDLPLIPKARYKFMDAYFSKLDGMHAERMMRGSASLQVSIDFADEADAVRKLRVISLLAPILTSITDNTPVFEGRVNTQPIRHLSLWREVDPARCGVLPHLFDEDYGFERYAEWLFETPPIFRTQAEVQSLAQDLGGDEQGVRQNEEQGVRQNETQAQAQTQGAHQNEAQTQAQTGAPKETYDLSAAEVYKAAPMTRADIEHLLSMFWPDVRLKRYIEIRPADALPLEPALGYVALIKGIFYGQNNLDFLEDALGAKENPADITGKSYPYTEQSIEEAIQEIIEKRDNASVYGRTVVEWIDYLFMLAARGLNTEVDYLEPLKDFYGM